MLFLATVHKTTNCSKNICFGQVILIEYVDLRVLQPATKFVILRNVSQKWMLLSYLCDSSMTHQWLMEFHTKKYTVFTSYFKYAVLFQKYIIENSRSLSNMVSHRYLSSMDLITIFFQIRPPIYIRRIFETDFSISKFLIFFLFFRK